MNKKIFYIASLALGLSLSSCEENDDFDPTYVAPNYFVGKWELTQIGSLNSANVLYYDDVEKEDNCEFDNVIFGADQSFAENDYTFDLGACESESDGGFYQLVDGNIVLSYRDNDPADGIDPDVLTFDVVSLNDTKLELSYTDEDTEELVFLKFTKS